MLNLVNKPTELKIIKSEIYEIAKNSATSVSLMDSPMIKKDSKVHFTTSIFLQQPSHEWG